MATPVALITGASSGIGAETARKLGARGYVVYGVARRTDRLAALTRDGVRTFAMDLTDDASVTAGVKQVIDEAGRIDLLVNSAGYGSLGSLEETSIDEGRRQFEVNVFGAMRLTQLAIPHMRAQHAGRVVNVSSIGGRIYSPLGGWYHGTKHALEAMSDCLRLEVSRFGIDVVIVEPGGTDTEWGPIAAGNVGKTSGQGPYAEQARAVAKSVTVGKFASAATVADAIIRAATTTRPRTRYVVGPGARQAVTARRLLPDRAFDALIRRA